MDFDLRSMRAFVELSRDMSFTRAAQRMSVTQPQLSMRIRALEERVGFRLFERSSRRVSITPQGEALLPDAVALVETCERVGQRALAIRLGQGSSLRIGAINYGRPIRRRLLSRYTALHPHVTVEVEAIRWGSEGLSGFGDARWDAAVLLAMDNQPLGPDVETLVLARLPVGVLLKQESGLSDYSMIPPAALCGGQVALFRRDISPWLHDAMLDRVSDHGVKIVRLPEASEEGVLEFVRETGIPAMCARWWDQDEDTPDGMVHRLIEGEQFAISCVLVRPHRQATRTSDRLWRLASSMATLPNHEPGASASHYIESLSIDAISA